MPFWDKWIRPTNHNPRAVASVQGQFADMSAQTFGKYQFCTGYDGVMYADSDFDGCRPKLGAIPSPSEEDRTPFGQRRKPILETEAMKRERWAREKTETHALLEQLASELVADAAADEPGWLKQFIAEYETDRAAYSFDAKCHGKFLTVFISRKANPQTEHPYSFFGGKNFPTEFSETFCVAGCQPPRLITGHEPDMDGALDFHYQCEYDNGNGSTIGGTGFGNYAAPKGQRWKVLAPKEFSRLPHGRPLFYADPPPEPNRGNVIQMDDNSYKIKTKVKPAARLAGDDRIRFDDLGKTIYAPSGMGAAVLEKIITAIR